VNVLPLVLTFLLLFSWLSFTFVREVKSALIVEAILQGYNRAERKVSNLIVCKAYREKAKESSTKTNSNPDKPKDTSKKSKTFASIREQFPPLEESKFNLGPLVECQEEPKLHPLYEPCAELLRLLYKKRLFDRYPHPQKVEYLILDTLLKKARANPDEEWITFSPEDPLLAKLFYKMLKGTNQYDADQGIPPLRDFFRLNEDQFAVCCNFASTTLLKAMFGPTITTAILTEEAHKSKEQDKRVLFSKEEFAAVVLKHPKYASLFSTLNPYLNFSKRPKKKQRIGEKDSLTGITIQKSLEEH
jgi:hypothetical protein